MPEPKIEPKISSAEAEYQRLSRQVDRLWRFGAALAVISAALIMASVILHVVAWVIA